MALIHNGTIQTKEEQEIAILSLQQLQLLNGHNCCMMFSNLLTKITPQEFMASHFSLEANHGLLILTMVLSGIRITQQMRLQQA